jgi:ankyrin repeat protein
MRAFIVILLASFVAAPALGQTVTARSSASATAPRAKRAASDTRLVDALKAADTAAALALLDQRVDVNVPEPDGTTALHWAVRLDDVALVNRLLRAGAKVKAANRYGVTPIQLACENGSAQAVSRLLEAGESANATGPYGETALMVCARTGKPEAAKVLIDHGADVDAVESWRGQTALMWATAQGHPAMMKLLIEAGADVNARSALQHWERQRTLEPRDKWLPEGGLTPLTFAARQGCVDCEKVLVDAGADINVLDPELRTPLVEALINGHYDAAALLIERGADVNAADQVGRTPLYAAVDDHTMPQSNRPAPKEIDNARTSMDIIQMLLDKGANVNAALRAQLPYRTKLDRGGDGVLGVGTTPLLRAARAGDVAVIKLLLSHGADAKAATRNRVTGIMMAASVNAKEEDMTGRNKTEKDAIETVKVLLAAGADINAAEAQGRTALHGAAQWGMTDLVKVLAGSGGNINAADRRGLTPLDYASGRAGGFGFDGKAGVAYPETAKAIEALGGNPGKPTGEALPERRPNGAQDDPN